LNPTHQKIVSECKSKYTMPRKDAYHDSVRTALEKEGWTISQDPLQIVVDETTVFIDLGIINH
jgi:hypothetical protein